MAVIGMYIPLIRRDPIRSGPFLRERRRAAKRGSGAKCPRAHFRRFHRRSPSPSPALTVLLFYAPAFPFGRAGGGGGREPDGNAGAALLRIDARIARITLRSVMNATIFIGPPQFEQTSGSTS